MKNNDNSRSRSLNKSSESSIDEKSKGEVEPCSMISRVNESQVSKCVNLLELEKAEEESRNDSKLM